MDRLKDEDEKPNASRLKPQNRRLIGLEGTRETESRVQRWRDPEIVDAAEVAAWEKEEQCILAEEVNGEINGEEREENEKEREI